MSEKFQEELATEIESAVTYGAGDLGVIVTGLKEAAAAVRSGDYLTAFRLLWEVIAEAKKAFVPAYGAGEEAVAVAGRWGEVLKKVLPLLLKLLPLLI